MDNQILISLVIPVFNEEESIPLFYKAIKESRELSAYQLELVFVDDGSKDNSWAIIEALAAADTSVVGESFSRNFGKEPALLAGINAATGDVIIPIDVDLQDPIDVIPLMIERYLDGADVVLAKRVDRSSDGFLKRTTAEMFYKVHNAISDIEIEENVGDFRLMSREIVESIKQLPERNLFMKGILSWVGGRVDCVEYVRSSRVAGSTKFNGWKLWNLALEGITSFSTLPLKVWTYLGLAVALFALAFAVYRLVSTLLYGNDVPGYSSIMVSIMFLGGIQLIGIGVLGEYIGRIYIESKRRPRYIVKKRITHDK